MSWSRARGWALLIVIVVLVSQVVAVHNQGARITRQGHDAIQQNVNARFDDCTNGEEVREQLRVEARKNAETDPVVFKLFPQLNTPSAKALIKARQKMDLARALAAYEPRDCGAFALRSVPPRSRAQYSVPRR